MGAINIFWFLKNLACPIGIDMGDDILKLIQVGNNAKGVYLIAGGSEKRPSDVKPGSANWQRWAIEALRKSTVNGKFHGRNIIAAISANEVFIDHIKKPKSSKAKNIEDAILSKIKQKLPFESDDAMIRYIPTTEDDNLVVIATEREKINRHLAIYEKVGLKIKSLGVWPTALTNCYTKFFGRRKTDIEMVVMLLDIEEKFTNVVICRHKNLLFARSISIGAEQLTTKKAVTRLVLELIACKQRFSLMHKNAQIERLIFLSGPIVDRNTYITIAKQMEMPAQIGDCMAAVKVGNPCELGIDRRKCEFSWASAFGLSLS